VKRNNLRACRFNPAVPPFVNAQEAHEDRNNPGQSHFVFKFNELNLKTAVQATKTINHGNMEETF
jgi:hypothetical protein